MPLPGLDRRESSEQWASFASGNKKRDRGIFKVNHNVVRVPSQIADKIQFLFPRTLFVIDDKPVNEPAALQNAFGSRPNDDGDPVFRKLYGKRHQNRRGYDHISDIAESDQKNFFRLASRFGKDNIFFQ